MDKTREAQIKFKRKWYPYNPDKFLGPRTLVLDTVLKPKVTEVPG